MDFIRPATAGRVVRFLHGYSHGFCANVARIAALIRPRFRAISHRRPQGPDNGPASCRHEAPVRPADGFYRVFNPALLYRGSARTFSGRSRTDEATLNPVPDMRSLRIIVINAVPPEGEQDETTLAQEERGRALRIGLLEAGYNIIASFPADIHLPERVAQMQPDMIIIDAESDSRDVLEHVVFATRDERRPIVLFTEDQGRSSMQAAMNAGVSAYVVAGLRSERIKPVLEVAMLRFQADQKLRAELDDTRSKLAERKVIDRAKGLLMASHKLSEEEAYQKLRGIAMNKNLKLAEVAQRLLDVSDLLG
jgi:response regulator NasT